MNKIPIIVICLLFGKLFSQETSEKTINTEVSEVTVFIKDSQIIRKKVIDLNQGITILKFVNLSPFIKSKSIHVKADGSITVLSVNQQQNFLNKLKKPDELIRLESSLKEINDQIRLEKVYLDIAKEELIFLSENRDIGGKNQQVNVENLRQASNFYKSRLTTLKLQEVEQDKKIVELKKKRFDLDNQIKTLTSEKNYPNGEIIVKVDSDKNSKVNFELSYIVGNSSWYPSYDIRAKSINDPIELIYKANVKQDTKVDWKNVKLKLSSANPNISGVAPELKPYFINYNTRPPSYKKDINLISGVVYDENRQPIPGVNVNVHGTTIGTSTDFDGRYSITVPNNSSELQFSFIGYITKKVFITTSNMNIYLDPSEETLDEVVVVARGIKREKKALGYTVSQEDEDLNEISPVSQPSMIPLEKNENQTTVDFEMKIPYTIKSDNKSYSVDMITNSLNTDYQYYAVPKIDTDAFLIASITDWEKFNLLEGEANIFFEDTYVGKSILDVRYESDTLSISLGRDKNIKIKRAKVGNYVSKKFVGSKKEESREWKISIKNNKNQTINMLIIDQVPVSTLDEIKVEIQNKSKGKYDGQSGEIKWEFTLNPKENKELDLKYMVRYPKNKRLIIE